MKKFYIVMVLAVALSAGASWAGNMSIGKTTLSGDSLELDNLTVKVNGHASLISNMPAGELRSGAMRLDSLKADDIKIAMVRDTKGRMSPKQASATGGVIIRAKRVDEEDGPNGKKVRILRDVNAVAKSAELQSEDNVVVLKGDVTIKVIEPGITDPLVTVTGETVEINMKTGKIKVLRGQDNPAGLTLSPKEGEKK